MCNYCKSNQTDIAKDGLGMNKKDGNTISICVIGEYGALDVYINDTLALDTKIKYCPMCGRKL